MAASDSSSSGADQQPSKTEDETITITNRHRIPRRKWTLAAITILLNLLLWSSIICLITAILQMASGPNVAGVFTLTSALVTLPYISLHTIISVKQRVWVHQRQRQPAIEKTSYVAVRIVITLCVFWLVTCGWNMIIVARRPICLPGGLGREAWEAGTTCYITRLGMAFAMIAFIVVCTLFGMLATVSRPFEAHVFKHGYRQPPGVQLPASIFRSPSRARPLSHASEKRPSGRRMSASRHRSRPSNTSNTDIESLDVNTNPNPYRLYAPSPVRSLGLGIFTCDDAPPAIPAVYALEPRISVLQPPPPIFQPAARASLPHPPRLSGIDPSSGSIPLLIAPQYSASAWRAVHPNAAPPTHPASRSYTHPPSASASFHHRYSRSSVSVTRPHRLSSGTPALSSRSNPTGPETQDDAPARRAPTHGVAFSIHRKPVSGNVKVKGHARTASAPDATSAAQQSERIVMG